ncbi:MAG: ferritin-like protein [Trichodesmium sp. MAG_R04]|nr:ferritin-like protein [Trichodesmium sp. MAG_R04]
MSVEHATIPPYLTALYSLKPGSNLEAFHMIRTVVVEEMLHLTLVANVFNAVGGNIDQVLTNEGFVPEYPGLLPGGIGDFCVDVDKFSPETVETFLNIERFEDMDGINGGASTKSPSDPKLSSLQGINFLLPIFGRNDDDENDPQYPSIGAFYEEIINGLYYLNDQNVDLFTGDESKQITREYYYDGAGEIFKVTDLESAIKALRIIQFQGEGSKNRTIYNNEGKLCHYYCFQQLKLGRYYVIDKEEDQYTDEPNHPTGDTFTVDWDAVYPVKKNVKLSDYQGDPELYDRGQDFERLYSCFLKQIECSFNGSPEKLVPAVGEMFRLRDLANSLIRNPIPGDEDGCHAGPIYR